MLRVCVVVAGLVAGTIGAAAQSPAGLASDKALFEKHRTEVARAWLKGEYPAVGTKIALCWKAYLDRISMDKAKDCYLLQAAAGKMIRGTYARLPHKVFTPEDLAERTGMALNLLQVPEEKQPAILDRWALATTGK